MPTTPDRYPGSREEDELVLTEDTVDPTSEGGIKYVSGLFRMKDSTGVYDPRSGSGVSEAQHKVLRQLIHFIDGGPAEGFSSGAYAESLPSGDPFPTSVTWWESSSKLKKIVDQVVTYNTNKTINTSQWRIYDTDGSTVLATVTDTMSYSGVIETSRTRTIA